MRTCWQTRVLSLSVLTPWGLLSWHLQFPLLWLLEVGPHLYSDHFKLCRFDRLCFYFKTLYSAENIHLIISDGERSAGQGGVCPVMCAQWPVASDRGPGCGARMARPGAGCRPQSVTDIRPEQSCGVRTRGHRNMTVTWSNIDGKSDWIVIWNYTNTVILDVGFFAEKLKCNLKQMEQFKLIRYINWQ